ncbi:MAG: S-layer homology domain-containing protein [Candidatus Margulisiibacteriota bacterium]
MWKSETRAFYNLTLVMIVGAFCFWPLFCLKSAEAVVYEPEDKSRTFAEILWLRGKVEGTGSLFVNNQFLKTTPDGSFSCGLVLNPGKNLVELRREKQKQEIRILRLVSYPDIEELYDQKKHWARGQIVYLSTLGIIEGEPDGNFYPGRAISRGEFATWLARAKNLPLSVLTQDVFFDVPKEHWRAPYIKAVVDAGLIVPYNRELFGIDDPISRREAAEIAVRTEGLGIVKKIIPLFKDVPKEEKGAEPIYTAWERGLVIGVSKDIPVYDPARALTRAEAATLIYRFSMVQTSINHLNNYELGYDSSRYCSLNVSPEVIAFKVEPFQVRIQQTSSLKIRAEIASRESFSPMAKVRVDLTPLGGIPDAEMFDDGTHGDEKENDLVYSLNVSYTPSEPGEKILKVIATDKLGWEGKKETSLLVVK